MVSHVSGVFFCPQLSILIGNTDSSQKVKGDAEYGQTGNETKATAKSRTDR